METRIDETNEINEMEITSDDRHELAKFNLFMDYLREERGFEVYEIAVEIFKEYHPRLLALGYKVEDDFSGEVRARISPQQQARQR